MQWCHVNFSAEDSCCHGNQPFLFKDKIGCRLTRVSNTETQLLGYIAWQWDSYLVPQNVFLIKIRNYQAATSKELCHNTKWNSSECVKWCRMSEVGAQLGHIPSVVCVTICRHRRRFSTCLRIQSMLFSTSSLCSALVPSSPRLGSMCLDPAQRMYVLLWRCITDLPSI